jgi:hypothetical protein
MQISEISTDQLQNSRRFLFLFLLEMMEGSGSGSVLVNNRSGCGSGMPKNIPDPNADPDPQLCFYEGIFSLIRTVKLRASSRIPPFDLGSWSSSTQRN